MGLTQAELARELSVSRQAIHDLVQRGVLDFDQDGKIDLESARAAIAGGVHPSAKTSAALQPSEYHAAKALREATEAARAQLALARERGEVIRVSAVRTALAHAYTTTREAILNMAARLAPQLAVESDPATIQSLLYAELHTAITAIASARAQFDCDTTS